MPTNQGEGPSKRAKFGQNLTNKIRSIKRTTTQAVKSCEKYNEIAKSMQDETMRMVVMWERKGKLHISGSEALLKKVFQKKYHGTNNCNRYQPFVRLSRLNEEMINSSSSPVFPTFQEETVDEEITIESFQPEPEPEIEQMRGKHLTSTLKHYSLRDNPKKKKRSSFSYY